MECICPKSWFSGHGALSRDSRDANLQLWSRCPFLNAPVGRASSRVSVPFCFVARREHATRGSPEPWVRASPGGEDVHQARGSKRHHVKRKRYQNRWRRADAAPVSLLMALER